MNFGFDGENSADAYRSLKSLVNTNSGVWKSRKQREFLLDNGRSPLKSLTCEHSVEVLPQGTLRYSVRSRDVNGRRARVFG